MATYNQPVPYVAGDYSNPNFLFAKKTERDEGAGIFTTLKTAIMNLGPDLAVELGYVGEMLKHPIDTGEVLLRAAAGYAQKGLPDSWEAYLPSDWATNKIYAEAINQHYIERYGSLEGAADAFAEKPVSVLLDVFIVKGVLTAAYRQSANLANKVNSTLNSAKGTPLEGEIAVRADAINQAGAEVNAASEATKAAEINKGALVFDETTGVYVPVSSVGESVKATEAAEVAGGSVIINGKVVHIPKPKPEVVATGEGTVIPLGGEVAAETVTKVSKAEIIKLSDEAKAANKNARKVEEKWMDVDELAMEPFWQSDVIPAKAAAIRAEIALETAKRNNAIANGEASLIRNADRALRERNIRLIAVEQDIKHAEAAGIYNNSLSLEELAKQAEAFPIITEAQKANMIRNGADEAAVVRNQQLAAELQAVLEARIAAGPKAAELPATVKQGELFNDGMITGTKTIDDALKTETVALSAEAAAAAKAAEAARYGLARKEAGNMYPNVAGTGMVTSKAADLSKLPDVSRLAKQAEIDDLARISKTAEEAAAARAAEAAKVAEATRYGLARKEAGDMYPAVKTSELATIGKGGDLASIPNIARPWKAAEISQKLPLDAIARTVKLAETAGNLNTTTGLGLEGLRAEDGSFYPDYKLDLTPAAPAEIPVIEKEEVVQERRPGWMQGNTYADNDGNFWSADFEHEYWNTPAGVNEAISIWGRPMGSRHSWETPAAIKNQYTYRQPADFSWMNEYD
jgi:hypothetical protein